MIIKQHPKNLINEDSQGLATNKDYNFCRSTDETNPRHNKNVLFLYITFLKNRYNKKGVTGKHIWACTGEATLPFHIILSNVYNHAMEGLLTASVSCTFLPYLTAVKINLQYLLKLISLHLIIQTQIFRWKFGQKLYKCTL